MMEDVQKPMQANTATRRTILARDFRAILALAAVPVVLQMITPKSAIADDRDDRHDRHDRGEGRHHDRGEGRDHDRGDHRGHGGGNCFLRGTRIATVAGERNVEDLAIGDLVPTVFGEIHPIQWIGRFRRIRSSFSKPWAKIARPVRIARSALAPNVPHSDLYVTQGHALLVDDLLIPAGSLINGTTISLYAAEAYDELEFFHIKLETHDVIYAEGAPCETLLRVDETMSNFADYARKHEAAEAQHVHRAAIVCHGRRNELRVRLRSLMSPWLGPQKFDIIRAQLEQRAMAMM
jgi:Hint domain